MSGYVIFTVHGLIYENDIPNEHLLHYVDNVFCVSQAIQNFLIIKKNINPLLIFQPVDWERFSPKNMLREKNIKVLGPNIVNIDEDLFIDDDTLLKILPGTIINFEGLFL